MAGKWSDWFAWLDVERRRGVKVPDASGVYEAREQGRDNRLTIGKASSLLSRVKSGLVRGIIPHSAGERIREHEDVSKVEVRWRSTDKPREVEKQLHREHKEKFGALPKHTRR